MSLRRSVFGGVGASGSADVTPSPHPHTHPATSIGSLFAFRDPHTAALFDREEEETNKQITGGRRETHTAPTANVTNNHNNSARRTNTRPDMNKKTMMTTDKTVQPFLHRPTTAAQAAAREAAAIIPKEQEQSDRKSHLPSSASSSQSHVRDAGHSRAGSDWPKEFESILLGGGFVSQIHAMDRRARSAAATDRHTGEDEDDTDDEDGRAAVARPPLPSRPASSTGLTPRPRIPPVQPPTVAAGPARSPREKRKAALVRSTHAGDSWTNAARTAIPMQFDPTATSISHASSMLEIQTHAKKLIAEDSLRLYKLTHASERERREQRSKPWRNACAVEADIHMQRATTPNTAIPPTTSVNSNHPTSTLVRPHSSLPYSLSNSSHSSSASASSAADEGVRSLTRELTVLLTQYSSNQRRVRAAERDSKRRALRQKRETDAADEREATAALLGSSIGPSRADVEDARKFELAESALETDADYLATSTDPIVVLVRQLQDQAVEDVIWSQVMDRLLADSPNPSSSSQPHRLLSKPLAHLLRHLHGHHQRIMVPLKQLLEKISEKLIQDWKITNLIDANKNAIQAASVEARFKESEVVGANAVNDEKQPSPSIPAPLSAAQVTSPSLDPRTLLSSRSTLAPTAQRIQTLQRRHLHRLEEELRREYRNSLDASEALRDTKEGLSARVHAGLFRQTYTRIVRKKAAELASGAGSAAANDSDHASRHLLDYDLVTNRLTRTDLVDSNGRPIPKTYVEDGLSHAMEDEDGGGGGVTRVIGESTNVDNDPSNNDVTRSPTTRSSTRSSTLVEGKTKNLVGMRRFLATFQHRRALPPGAKDLPVILSTNTEFRPSLDLRCNSNDDLRNLRQELRTFGMMRFIQQQCQSGGFMRTLEGEVQVTMDEKHNPFARDLASAADGSADGIGDSSTFRDRLSEHGMIDESRHFLVATPSEDQQANWESLQIEWIGRAAMAKRHEMLVARDQSWNISNIAWMGIPTKTSTVPKLMKSYQVDELHRCLHLIDRLESIARTYTARAGWSNDVGLFFQPYPFTSSLQLHLHMIDLSCVGPSFQCNYYKNLPLEDVRQVLYDELDHIDSHAASVWKEETEKRIAPARQALLTRPVLRIHALRNGDMLSGQVAYHSYYYIFKLSSTENGAWFRLIQHPSDLYQQYSHPSREGAAAGGGGGEGDQRLVMGNPSPTAAEDESNWIEIYLNPGSPPTRTRHTHKATTKGTGMCSLDLRSGVSDWHQAGRPDPITLSELLSTSSSTPDSMLSQSSEWYLRIIGRGSRPKGFTLEFRTNTDVLNYSSVFNQLLHDLEEQSSWQESLSDKMVTVDQLLAAFLPQPTFPEPNDTPNVSLEAMYPNPEERPMKVEHATQTHITALHVIDVEASMRRKEEEEHLTRMSEASRLEEARRHVISIGGMGRLFRHPHVPIGQLRIWSETSLLKLIQSVYKAKILYDSEFEDQLYQFQLTTSARTRGETLSSTSTGSHPPAPLSLQAPKKLPFNEFVYSYFVDRYGLVKLAETYIREFIHSIELRYLPLPRVSLFSRMIEIFTPIYTQSEIEFYFQTLKTLWRWCNTHNILPENGGGGHGRTILPYYVVEDALFDLWNVQSLQSQTKFLSLNSRTNGGGGASSATGSVGVVPASAVSTRVSSDKELELSLRRQEVAQIAWCQHLLKKLVPMLQVTETIEVYDHRNHLLKARAPKVNRHYHMDQDEFLQLLIDHGTRAMNKTVEELKEVWGRMSMANSMALAANRNKKGDKHNANAATTGGDTTAPREEDENHDSKKFGFNRTTDNIGLKLPDFLGLLRIEVPWFDDLELFLLYYECLHSTSLRRSEDSVYLDGWLRIGIRYEMLHPTRPEEETELDQNQNQANSTPPPPTKPIVTPHTIKIDGFDRSGPIQNTAGRPPVPSSKLHLTTHRLPYPALVLPGYRAVSKAEAKEKSSSSPKKGMKKVASNGVGQGASQPSLRYKNVGRLVWDELALAREMPIKQEKPREMALGTGTVEPIRRPITLLDSSPHLPPSLSPIGELTPLQSLRLLGSIHTLLQPILIDHLNRIQVWWQLPGAFTSDQLRARSSKLAGIYELLSEFQMHMDRRLGSGPQIVIVKETTEEAEREHNDRPHDDDSMYESGSDDERARPKSGDKSHPAVVFPVGRPKLTPAELEDIAQTCWSLFRQLLARCTDLFILHSPIYEQLSILKSPDGKAMVSTEFAGGDVNRALARHGTGSQTTLTNNIN